ncbi:MAG: TIGR00299 family protein [Desulfobulbus propionicus]|nr:MAG: TIGR00299 family protein [Desulfobulbus propionicus]
MNSSRCLYLDCFSGISGNMLLGALIDAGVPAEHIVNTVQQLAIQGYRIDIRKATVHGFAAHQVQIQAETGHDHRHLAEIQTLVGQAAIRQEIRDTAIRVFERLAQAEAEVHGTTPEQIHFHEVGAVDALVDVVGCVAGLHYLDIAHVTCSPLPMARGWVRCAHGEIPLPAPAVCRLLQGAPVYGVPLQQELVTPTGAALAMELAHRFDHLPTMNMTAIGYGAGTMTRDDGRPNLLRIIIGTQKKTPETGQVTVIETHIDDWNPEFWPHVSELLMHHGALDVSLTPMQMKKGRPGFLVRVICSAEQTQPLRDILFAETSAIGLRQRLEDRVILPRKQITLQTPWGPVKAKEIQTDQGSVTTPEYEACRAIAHKHGIPLQKVYHSIRSYDMAGNNGEKE